MLLGILEEKLADIVLFALTPGEGGAAWLKLPAAFDLRAERGWFCTSVLPRIKPSQCADEALLDAGSWAAGLTSPSIPPFPPPADHGDGAWTQ